MMIDQFEAIIEALRSEPVFEKRSQLAANYFSNLFIQYDTGQISHDLPYKERSIRRLTASFEGFTKYPNKVAHKVLVYLGHTPEAADLLILALKEGGSSYYTGKSIDSRIRAQFDDTIKALTDVGPGKSGLMFAKYLVTLCEITDILSEIESKLDRGCPHV